MSDWVDIYHPDFWDADEMGEEKPEPGNPEHDGRWSRVTNEAYELNWAKRGWEKIAAAPSPVGSLQGEASVAAPTSDEEDSTPEKSSSSRKSAAKK